KVDSDVDIVADDYAAAVNVGVPFNAVILAIDFCGGIGGDASVAPGILDRIGRAFDVENNFFGDAANGEIAGDFQLAGRNVFNFLGFKGDRGVFSGVEEPVAAEIVVALGFAGVNGSGVNGDVDGGFGNVLIVPDDSAVDTLELAAHRRNHK